ncbi:type I-B CRISPR-associated protein Cas5b [Halocella sp. SP3-1]|uniref:type I-B CRISPR-associated protein Cas5b n=1 Tax=Halocella sp. SP3-1 TaxID=2382161 RepID=UPI000F75348E|nr:type I-B CRISPR-associated protein Cas5b [Halocella sp. SP3-1]AZO96391.1 type I-B CRISPR-associated protein Cas5 [Halocella sp. SP3-1]
MSKLLCFDIWAEYAHFKKYYTTTSPLSFSVPPKTTIYGLIGAILGLDKNEYLDYFQAGQCKLGIQIIKPVKKTRINLNLIDTKTAKMMSRIKNRTQIKTEFLKDASYRIFFQHQNQDLYNKLKDFIQAHKSFYSISLGLSENLANFQYVAEYDYQKISDNYEWVDIVTALMIGNFLGQGDIDFNEEGKEYFADKVALEMKPDREVLNYAQIVYERNGQSIKAKPREYCQLTTGENCFLI